MDKVMMLNYYLLNVVKGEMAANLMYAFSVLMNYGNELTVKDAELLIDEKLMKFLFDRGYITRNFTNPSYLQLGNAWYNTMENAEKYFYDKFPEVITVF